MNQTCRPLMGGNCVQTASVLLLSCLLCTFFLATLAGCGDEKPELPKLKQTVRQEQPAVPADSKNSAAQEPLGGGKAGVLSSSEAPVGTSISRGHSPKSTRDPFRSFIEIKTRSTVVQKAAKVLTPLQRYSLDQLKVVGILEGTNVRKALVEDDVGKGFVVERGAAIGNQGGKITSITSDRVVIEETYEDALGNRKVRRITKKLYSSE